VQKRWSAISGPRAQFYFVVAELRRRVPPAGTPHKKACTTLANHRDELLAFAAELDERLAALAGQFQVERCPRRFVVSRLTLGCAEVDLDVALSSSRICFMA